MSIVLCIGYMQEQGIHLSFQNLQPFFASSSVQHVEASLRLTEEMQTEREENDKDFLVFQEDRFLDSFASYAEAVTYAKTFAQADVFYTDSDHAVWSNVQKAPVQILLDAPLIPQLPELPRGCEVTSLAMLLEYAGLEVNKMTLAQEVRKDSTPYQRQNGQVYFGNPYEGFVGDMYSWDKPGLGVYHGPIRDLAQGYLPGQIIDMTDSQFEDILYPLSNGSPVWVIIHTRYNHLPEHSFQTWQTPTGPLKITYHMHSVLITGYDERFIYFNDPLTNLKNRKVAIGNFKAAWEQMGSQAITYTN